MKLFLFFMTFFLVISGCGVVNLGSSGSDAAAPGCCLVASGPFTDQVTGEAEIYNTGNGSFVARLDSVTVPSQSGLQVLVIAGGATIETFSLQSNSGSQNYSFTQTGTPTFNQVKISTTGGTDIGIADL